MTAHEHYLNMVRSADGFPSISGKHISMSNPSPEQFEAGDIAGGLAKVCRFGGQIYGFYSVAQHSVLVSRMCPPKLKLAGLFHDSPEAYLGDVVKPLKILIAELYGPIEDRFEAAICLRFGLDRALLPLVKEYDLQAFYLEAARLRNATTRGWVARHSELGLDPDLWSPGKAEWKFMEEFTRLTAGRYV